MSKVKYKNKEGVVIGRCTTRKGESLALVRFFGNKTASRVPWEKLERVKKPVPKSKGPEQHVEPYWVID